MGKVEVIKIIQGKTVEELEGYNLLVDQAGEHIADFMTISPSLQYIESASAILDASNYTIHSVTLGKDSEGFNDRHAHLDAWWTYSDAIRVVQNPTELSLSSYHSSATDYKLFPDPPRPTDTRLESGSTLSPSAQIDSNFSALDIGHYLNSIPSSMWGSTPDGRMTMGAYAPSGGIVFGLLESLAASASPLYVSAAFGQFNTDSVVDKKGFINVTIPIADDGNSAVVANTSGVYVTADNFETDLKVDYNFSIEKGDIVALGLYGGVYQVGLWVLDIKAILGEGLAPPFNFTNINNQLQYKLFAKKSFTRDLVYITDAGATPGFDPVFTLTAEIKIKWGLAF